MPVQRGRRPRTVAALVALTLFGGAVAAPRSADLFDQIYEKGKPLEAALKTLTARFSETSESPLLDKPLVARGRVTVIRPSKVRLDYESPDPRTVVINGDTLTLTWPSQNLTRRTDIGAAQRRIDRYFVDSSPKELRSHFDIVAAAATDRQGSWLLRMTPKRKQIQEGLSLLELWVDQKSVMLQAMRIRFASGDTKLMAFEDVTVNPPVDEALFATPPTRR